MLLESWFKIISQLPFFENSISLGVFPRLLISLTKLTFIVLCSDLSMLKTDILSVNLFEPIYGVI